MSPKDILMKQCKQWPGGEIAFSNGMVYYPDELTWDTTPNAIQLIAFNDLPIRQFSYRQKHLDCFFEENIIILNKDEIEILNYEIEWWSIRI